MSQTLYELIVKVLVFFHKEQRDENSSKIDQSL